MTNEHSCLYAKIKDVLADISRGWEDLHFPKKAPFLEEKKIERRDGRERGGEKGEKRHSFLKCYPQKNVTV